ncbi:hypothetical protein Taro_006497 [Colocasia esculenta]|uniref:Uncharacterized protein n=1 Tax=Colocasia esculenta TaxID=4460 RepID=A0A843TSL9_COLES|nr:hypothetical protein [Colocasia esculenta]
MGKTAATRVTTVEYLEPSMSRQLLCKFPDDSAFDFDYTQSGIWSPLVPHGGGGSIFLSCPFPGVVGGRRLFSEGHYEKVSSQEKAKRKKLSKVEGKIRKKVAKKGGASKKGYGFSADCSASPTPKKHMQHKHVFEQALEARKKVWEVQGVSEAGVTEMSMVIYMRKGSNRGCPERRRVSTVTLPLKVGWTGEHDRIGFSMHGMSCSVLVWFGIVYI